MSTATLSTAGTVDGGTVSVTGGTNWWGGGGGAEPNSGPYGDAQVGAYYQVGAPQVYIGTSRATAVPATNSNVTLTANDYVCTGAESSTVGPNPCTMTPGAPTGSFQVPASLAPGTYNVYLDAPNTTPLPGNGPNDAYQTAQGTNLGTDEAVTQLDVEGVSLVKSTTSTGFGTAGDTIPYTYLVTNSGPDTITGVGVSDNLIPTVNCPDSSLAGGASETCTATYTVTQADVDAGSVTNTATASATDAYGDTLTSAPSSVTVNASNASSSLTLVKSTTSSGYGAAGDTIPYSYLVTNTGTKTLHGISVSDNLIPTVNCPDSTLGVRGLGDVHRHLHRDPGRRRHRLGDQHGHGQWHRPPGQHPDLGAVVGHGERLERLLERDAGQVDDLHAATARRGTPSPTATW